MKQIQKQSVYPLMCVVVLWVSGCVTPTLPEAPIWDSEAMPQQLLKKGAGEGPAWDPKLGLLFSGNQHIHRWQPDHGLQLFREKAGTNGLTFDNQGRLLACEPAQRQVTRLELDGRLTVLSSHYKGSIYNTPNDITTDSLGRIYFSDPRYGNRSDMEMKDDDGRIVEGVYCIHLDGSIERVITHEVDRPNGVLVSGDGRYLFVADNNNNTVDGAHKLWRFRRKTNGSLHLNSRKLIFDWGTSRGPDGMVQDKLGRIYVAAGLNTDNEPYETRLPYPAGIFVFSEQGMLLDHLPIPNDEVTNCTFGSRDLKTLYVTAGGSLWSMRTHVPGNLIWPGEQP
ncbi:MAG: SMP-30/gluconolactonase/LRE family protein [Verrucomicrobiota bacterium]|nr:SMP-30/gluconolactonase/LRE family protein [Verrucomicrobiota bacterium]